MAKNPSISREQRKHNKNNIENKSNAQSKPNKKLDCLLALMDKKTKKMYTFLFCDYN